jgi:HPt (histidine-containing phosphotransfer) domain-containing protein
VNTLDAAIAARDYRAIRQTAHAIGSAAANITATAVWRQGGVIQERVDSGQTADVAELASTMAADTRALIEELGQWLAPARTGA